MPVFMAFEGGLPMPFGQHKLVLQNAHHLFSPVERLADAVWAVEACFAKRSPSGFNAAGHMICFIKTLTLSSF